MVYIPTVGMEGSDMSDTREDEAVGYGNPPKHSQFKKGQSGNPAGRPKSKVTSMLAGLLNAEFEYKGLIWTRLEFLMTKLVVDAEHNPASMRMLLNELRHRDIFEVSKPEARDARYVSPDAAESAAAGTGSPETAETNDGEREITPADEIVEASTNAEKTGSETS
jgi:ribosomal protein L12E/L44/L45/RPP1/RPP2